MNKGTKGAILASAVAALFIATAAMAQDSSSTASSAAVKCVAANSCKGQGACKSADNSCKGQNACKGKGFVMMPSADACTKAGGHPAS